MTPNKRIFLKIVLVACASWLAGCAQLRIVADERNPREGEMSKSVVGWSGDLEGGRKTERVAREQTLGAVTIHSSYWKALGTVLTFGYWHPYDVIYEVNDDSPKESK